MSVPKVFLSVPCPSWLFADVTSSSHGKALDRIFKVSPSVPLRLDNPLPTNPLCAYDCYGDENSSLVCLHLSLSPRAVYVLGKGFTTEPHFSLWLALPSFDKCLPLHIERLSL